MKSNHSVEPWSVNESFPTAIYGPDCMIASTKTEMVFKDRMEANARRITAAVNACAGIPTEELEGAGAGFWGRYAARNGKQRDEVLDVLKAIINEWPRQKNLFPELNRDGWMDLAIKNGQRVIDNLPSESASYFIGTPEGIEDIDAKQLDDMMEAQAEARRLKSERIEAEHYPVDPNEPDYDNQAKDYAEDQRFAEQPTEYDS